MNIRIPNWYITFNYSACSFEADFDININAKMKTEVDTCYWLKIYDIINHGKINMDVEPREWYQFWNYPWCWAFEEIVLPFIYEYQFADQFEDEMRDMRVEIFPIKDLPGDCTDPNLVQEAINSFPIDFSFYNDSSPDSNLVICIDFMKGTQTNPNAFINIQPDPVNHDSYDHIGFACQFDNFMYAYLNSSWPNHSIDNPIECATTMLNLMASTSAQSIRLEVPWLKIQSNIPTNKVNCGLDPDFLDTPAGQEIINNFMNLSTWQDFDAVFSMIMNQKYEPILQIGLGHTAHVPRVGSGLYMAPNNPIGQIDNTYFVDENTYLYYLKLFAHATVRRYCNQVAYWMIEGEFNVTKFNHLFYGWRLGNLWDDETSGGFQDKVWDILVNAVRNEDPTAKIVANFHMLNLVKGLERFGSDCDVIGVNLYPNMRFALPVLGFAPGELVWATRRALKGLGMGNKEVWVTETNYPAISSSNPPPDITLEEDLLYYSYSRQADYLQSAIETSLEFGAKGFFWFSFWLYEVKSYGDYTEYGGLIPKNTLSLKQPTASRASTTTLNNHPGKCAVLLTNKNLTSGVNLGGKISLAGERDSLQSGEKPVYALRDRTHISRTDQRVLQGLVHNHWNTNDDFKLAESFEIGEDLQEYSRVAYFTSTANITISTNLPQASIEFWDPWYYIEETQTQPDCYRTVSPGNFSVFTNQNPEFSTTKPIYSLKVPQPHTVNLGGAIGVRPVYFLNWSYDANKATLKYPNASETPVVFKTSDATITANLKASLISSSSSAFSNDSRRKFVRTQDGWLHMVYESEGHIWYEAKPPDGDWRLIKVPGNNGHPYLDVNGGSSPAMDCYNIDDWNEYRVYISFKEGNYIQVYRFAYYSYANNYAYDGMCNLYIAESFYSPNIASSKDGFFMIVYKTSSGINYRLGAGEPGNGIWILPKYGIISGTNSNSESAAISGISLETGWSSFDIAWLQLTPPPPAPPLVSVKYCQLEYDHLYNNVTYSAPPQTVSSSSMKINSNPSIISLPDVPRIGWIADMSGTYDPWQTYATMCKIYPSISYNMYNYQSKSASINKLDNDSKYYFTWSQVYYMYGWIKNNFAVCSTSPNVIENLNTWGQDLQLCNGPNSSNMYVLSFYPYSTPYYFVKSNSLGSAGLGKTTEYPYSGKRGIVLENNNAGLYYSIGNIAVDGVSINFIPNVDEISKRGNRDSVKYHGSKSIYNNTETVNGLLVSEPFDLKKDSQIEFNDYFGVADSVAGVSVLGENGYITFKVELLDDASDKVIGTIKESEFTIRNLRPNELSAYKLSRGLPAGRKVKIRIVLSTNVENPQWSIIDDYMDLKDGLKKISAKEISLESSEFITDYALHRAYPNPFNPKTTFRFDLPEETHVEIVVYDLMGREVWKSAKTHYSAGTY
ncbi:MAG TPA: hypothetical protein PKV79_09715, partial [Candidatus Marinimicrobia bacterium]|nr:hypothetical protein [Candidatus Neomarinimicrobiota bacterium]